MRKPRVRSNASKPLRPWCTQGSFRPCNNKHRRSRKIFGFMSCCSTDGPNQPCCPLCANCYICRRSLPARALSAQTASTANLQSCTAKSYTSSNEITQLCTRLKKVALALWLVIGVNWCCWILEVEPDTTPESMEAAITGTRHKIERCSNAEGPVARANKRNVVLSLFLCHPTAAFQERMHWPGAHIFFVQGANNGPRAS